MVTISCDWAYWIALTWQYLSWLIIRLEQFAVLVSQSTQEIRKYCTKYWCRAEMHKACIKFILNVSPFDLHQLHLKAHLNCHGYHVTNWNNLSLSFHLSTTYFSVSFAFVQINFTWYWFCLSMWLIHKRISKFGHISMYECTFFRQTWCRINKEILIMIFTNSPS